MSRFVRFGVTGILGAVSFCLLVFGMVEIMELAVMVATCLAFLAVVLQNYLFHHHWTFRSNRSHRDSLPKFFLMSVTGFGLNWMIMWIGTQKLGGDYRGVQLLSVTAVICWNYAVSVYWIF